MLFSNLGWMDEELGFGGSVLRSLLSIIFVLGSLSACATFTCAAVAPQSKPLSETPDPYFSGKSAAKSDVVSSTKNSGVASANQGSAGETASLWSAPKTNTGVLTSKPLRPLLGGWDVNPNTKVDAGAQSLVRPPSSIPLGSSIIRENAAAPKGALSSDNDFAAPLSKPLKPLGSSTKDAPSTENSKSSVDQFGGGSTSKSSPGPLASQGSSAKPLGSESKKNGGSASKSAGSDSKNKAGNQGSGNKKKAESFEEFEPGRVLALVGGDPIFVGDILFEANQIIDRFMAAAPPEIKARERKKIITRLLPKFVESKILFLGSIQGLPDGVDIDDVLDQAATEFDSSALKELIAGAGLKSAAEFDAHLRAQGSSLRKFRRKWSKDQLTRYFISQQINVPSEVSHQELLDEYKKNIASYQIAPKCRWEQIMIRFDRAANRREAKEKIVELGNKIVGGANLNAVAKKSSHGFRASRGGLFDWTRKDSLALKKVDEAIFSQPVGALGEIVESRDGFHIIRVLERTEATQTPFLEAQVEIKKRILERKRQTAFREHVEKLKDQIPVEYLINNDTALTIN